MAGNTETELAMNSSQFTKYLSLIDHPPQLPLLPDLATLFRIFHSHMTTFPYQNLDLYLGGPLVDLSIDSLLDTLPVWGGHCYQHSELMFAVLEYIGFKLERVAARVIKSTEVDQEGLKRPPRHNLLVVHMGNDKYLVDPGFAGASPRFPIRFNFLITEEVHVSAGDHYKLEVEDNFYRLNWMLKGTWLILYQFERDPVTRLGKVENKETTAYMCKDLYDSPELVPIRDNFVQITSHTHDSRIKFSFQSGEYSLKIHSRGKTLVSKVLEYDTWFELVEEVCKLKFEAKKIEKCLDPL